MSLTRLIFLYLLQTIRFLIPKRNSKTQSIDINIKSLLYFCVWLVWTLANECRQQCSVWHFCWHTSPHNRLYEPKPAFVNWTFCVFWQHFPIHALCLYEMCLTPIPIQLRNYFLFAICNKKLCTIYFLNLSCTICLCSNTFEGP